MATDYLSLFAAHNNFKIYKNKIYGVYNGYNACICVRGATVACYFSTQIIDLKSFYACMQTQAAAHGILDYKVMPPFVAVMAQNTPIKNVLDFSTQLLALCKASTYELCPLCQLQLVEADRNFYTFNEVVTVAHDECMTVLSDKFNSRFFVLKQSQTPWYTALPSVLFASLIITLLTTITSIAMYLSYASVLIFGSMLMGYLTSSLYLKKNARWGVHMYLTCFIVGFVFNFISQSLCSAYAIMVSGLSTDFFGALGQYFSQWISPAYATHLITLALCTVALICGIALKEYQRIAFIRRSVVKIIKI